MALRNENIVLKFTAEADIQPNTVMLFPGSTFAGLTTNVNVAKAGDEVGLNTECVVELPSATGTVIANGASVEWDATNKLVVAASGGDFDLGRLLKAKASGQLTAWVIISKGIL